LRKDKPFADTDGFYFRGIGQKWSAAAGVSTNCDYKILEERYVNGINLILKNHVYGDSVKFQVVDKEFLFAGVLYPATYTGGIPWSTAVPTGVVLNEFGSSWYVSEDTQAQGFLILPYPAKLLANFYIRIVYTSTAANAVDVCANLFLHKKT
jgi:hypothetical protein